MSLMAANEESDPSAILNGFWVTLFSVSVFAVSILPRWYRSEQYQALPLWSLHSGM